MDYPVYCIVPVVKYNDKNYQNMNEMNFIKGFKNHESSQLPQQSSSIMASLIANTRYPLSMCRNLRSDARIQIVFRLISDTHE